LVVKLPSNVCTPTYHMVERAAGAAVAAAAVSGPEDEKAFRNVRSCLMFASPAKAGFATRSLQPSRRRFGHAMLRHMLPVKAKTRKVSTHTHRDKSMVR